MRALSLLFLFLLLFSSCGGRKAVVVSPTQPPKERECKYTYKVNGKTYCVRKSAEGFIQVGIASWYGPGFHGRRTASGEIYDMHKLTAAHKTLPLGTVVKVINLENGKSVIVRINDRGPFVEGRIIDLSHEAAKRLGMLTKGTAKVKIIALSSPSPSTSFGKEKSENFYVQVGAFKNKLNAYTYRWKLHKRGIRAIVVKLRGYYRVLVGPAKSLSAAEKLKKKLLSKGLHGSFIIAL